MAATTTKPKVTSVLPDGDALGNDILTASAGRQVKSLLRKGGQSVKATDGRDAPRVMFQPNAWSFSGNID